MILWCQEFEQQIKSEHTCNLRRRHPEMTECEGCQGPVIKRHVTKGHNLACKTCGSEITRYSKSGLCRKCSINRTIRNPRVRQRGVETRKRMYLEGKENAQIISGVVTVDLTQYPELLASIKDMATNELRSISQQITYLLLKHVMQRKE